MLGDSSPSKLVSKPRIQVWAEVFGQESGRKGTLRENHAALWVPRTSRNKPKGRTRAELCSTPSCGSGRCLDLYGISAFSHFFLFFALHFQSYAEQVSAHVAEESRDISELGIRGTQTFTSRPTRIINYCGGR